MLKWSIPWTVVRKKVLQALQAKEGDLRRANTQISRLLQENLTMSSQYEEIIARLEGRTGKKLRSPEGANDANMAGHWAGIVAGVLSGRVGCCAGSHVCAVAINPHCLATANAIGRVRGNAAGL